MATALRAHVIPENGEAFDAMVANLAPSSLYLVTDAPLTFKQALTLQLGEISLHGEVAFACTEPAGVVVVFRASAEALVALEDFMDALPVVVGGSQGTSLEDFQAMTDAEIDAIPEGDPEGPTNTEGEPVDVEDEELDDPAKDAAAEVRQAYRRSNFPPNLATERVGSEQILALKSAALSTRRPDRDPTVIPQPGEITDIGLDDATESGIEEAPAPQEVRTVDVEADERTVVPAKAAEE
ncbi:MAG: hypothetical protein KC933_36035 [Myxococcales bacterium]|nr:hypothetical protein [Myxococcales bacterium]MCB9648750.1 hypothetical protein [Deltaproteobacteria bacterium]